MAQSWAEIAAAIRAENAPITSSLLKRYWQRDESLREHHCPVPQTNGTHTGDTAWSTVVDSWIWVPQWAVTLNVVLAFFVDTGDANLRVNVNGTMSSQLNCDWTVTQDDTFTVAVADGDLGSRQEMLLQCETSAGGVTVDLTLKELWWTQ